MSASKLNRAIDAINKHSALLVFPIKNKIEPLSLWQVFHPRTKMDWDWSEDGNNLVARMWHLREELSRSDLVVYTKWYQGRATFFSTSFFPYILSYFSQKLDWDRTLSEHARYIYRALLENSPQAPKQLRRTLRDEYGLELTAAELEKVVKQLFRYLLIVGYGEIDEGAFPSLAIGASKNIFEELWDKSLTISTAQRSEAIENLLPRNSTFAKYIMKKCAQLEVTRI